MKQEEDKWAESYRSRLEDYSEPVSQEIWNSLDKELSKPLKIIGRPYRKLAVAAVVLLAIVSSVSIIFLRTPQAEYVKEARTIIPVSEPSGRPEPVLPHKLTDITAKVYANNNKFRTKGETISEKSIEIIADTVAGVAESNDVPVEDKVEVNNNVPAMRNAPSDNSGFNDSRTLIKRSRNMNKKWSVGVSLGNSPVSADNGRAGFGTLPPGMKDRDTEPYTISELMLPDDGMGGINPVAGEAYRSILINSIDKDTYTDVKHRMPFTVGASFRFGLSHNFSIETGLNYTLLSSELRSGTEIDYYLKDQKLHYLGIPIKGNWMFLNNKYFSLYLSAGGAVEMCVSGTLKSEYITSTGTKVQDDEKQRVKPLQWSVTSAIGAQYNATRHVGVFVEPGVVYYFNDGSPLKTIRKEKPFNFNLQMGLRFTY